VSVICISTAAANPATTSIASSSSPSSALRGRPPRPRPTAPVGAGVAGSAGAVTSVILLYRQLRSLFGTAVDFDGWRDRRDRIRAGPDAVVGGRFGSPLGRGRRLRAGRVGRRAAGRLPAGRRGGGGRAE